jgi:hypothetical protein
VSEQHSFLTNQLRLMCSNKKTSRRMTSSSQSSIVHSHRFNHQVGFRSIISSNKARGQCTKYQLHLSNLTVNSGPVLAESLASPVLAVEEGLKVLKNNYRLKFLVGISIQLKEEKEVDQERDKCSNIMLQLTSALGKEAAKV